MSNILHIILKRLKKTLEFLCDYLKTILPKGDFRELYCCWIGEEEEPIEQKVIIELNSLTEDAIYIEEKYHFTLTNS